MSSFAVRLFAAALVVGAGVAATAQSPAPPASPASPKSLVPDYETVAVGPVPPEFGYDPTFYKKYVDAIGIPVISSEKVPDRALLMARDIVVYMLANRPDLRREMIARKYRVGIMAQTEMTTDIPEQRDRKKPSRDDARLTRSERENYDKPGGIGSQTDKQVPGTAGHVAWAASIPPAPRRTSWATKARATTASTSSSTSGRTES